MSEFRIENEIVLRPYIDNDAEELYAAVKANYNHLQTFLFWVTPDYSLESAKEFIQLSQKESAEKKREGYGIFYNGKLIGSVGFINFSWNSKRTEIGYWIAKDFEGKGVITKSCKVLINYAFNELDLNRIEIRCATDNIRSRSIPERLDFQLEGILRQSLWRHTRFLDTAIYGLLKEDWRIFTI